MKCISCESEINPQWVHAIEQNICPFCGKSILEEHLKKLLSTLRDTMDQLLQYQTQLDDWMLSNHSYIKTNSVDLINYLPKEALKDFKKGQDDKDFDKRKFTIKVQTEDGVQEVQAEKVQSEERTNEFFKRAEVTKTPRQSGSKGPDTQITFSSPTEKTAHLKEMAKQIRKAGSQGITLGDASMMLSPEMLEQADPEAVAEFQVMIDGGEVASSLSDYSSDDEVPSHILAANQAMAAKKGAGGNSGISNPADLFKLQQMQDRVKNSKANFDSGANRGKGGFSRAG